jgi:DNA polymerase III epsilon subunit-like protein
MRIAVVDTETNGTEPWRHSLWEFGAVMVDSEDTAQDPTPLGFQVEADVENASPQALAVGRYFERRGGTILAEPGPTAMGMAERLAGARFASCNVSFDTAFVTRFLRDNGAVPTWHYSPIDIKSLAYGRRRSLMGASTSDLLKAYGVNVEQCLAYYGVRRSGRHSALADAWLAAALLYEVMGWGTLYGSRCDAIWGSYRCGLPFDGHETHRAKGALRGQADTTWETDPDGSFSIGDLHGTGMPSYPEEV